MAQKFDDLPIEIQEVMLAEQKRQGRREDPDAFREDIAGGFTWDEALPIYRTQEGEDSEMDVGGFWYDILIEGNTELFFKYYPRKPKYKTINIGEEMFNI